jgi:hypothetical protein
MVYQEFQKLVTMEVFVAMQCKLIPGLIFHHVDPDQLVLQVVSFQILSCWMSLLHPLVSVQHPEGMGGKSENFITISNKVELARLPF